MDTDFPNCFLSCHLVKREDVGAYVQDKSTISKYYGTLEVYLQKGLQKQSKKFGKGIAENQGERTQRGSGGYSKKGIDKDDCIFSY